MRRLPTALVSAVLTIAPLAAVGAGAVSSPSSAVTGCPAFRLDTAKQADAVFDGRVRGPAKTTRGGGPITYPVAVQSSYKGAASGSITVRMPAGACQVRGLKTGEDYVFLVAHNASGWVTARATRSVVAYHENLNRRLHALLDKPTPPPTVTFGEPMSGQPSSFARVAAPGAAMLIVGLLGYVVVRRIGRRAS